jgi:succinylglutamate desuccinylase
MSKASEEELADLHAAVAKKLKTMLKDPECSAQDIAQAIKFLKDNNIAADIGYSKPLKDLKEQVDSKTLPFPISRSN